MVREEGIERLMLYAQRLIMQKQDFGSRAQLLILATLDQLGERRLRTTRSCRQFFSSFLFLFLNRDLRSSEGKAEHCSSTCNVDCESDADNYSRRS